MLADVVSVTLSAHRFDASIGALVRTLGYRLESSDVIDPGLAGFWNASPLADRRIALLRSESGHPFLIRVVENDPVPGYAPLSTPGWNAIELLVENVQELAERLAASDFEVLGGPRDLLGNGTAIALQAAGPSGEVFYLTQISGKRMQAAYGRAEAFVDRPFIVVLGASRHERSMDFYGRLAGRRTRPRRFAIRALSAAHGLDADTQFDIASAVCASGFRIEIDGYPDSATRRVAAPSGLVPGLALITATARSLDSLPSAGRVRTVTLDTAPYDGRRVALYRGPDGELTEVVETGES